MKWNIKKGDTVMVIAGADRGKSARVSEVLRDKNRVIVEGLNMHTRHTKPNATSPQGGLVKSEGGIHISNVALMSDGKPTRVGRREVKGVTVRYAKKTDKNID
jgi:large subunit ribosomal protein L24